MTTVFDKLQNLLTQEEPNYNRLRWELLQIQGELSPLERVQSQPVIRLLQALEQFNEQQTKAPDVAVLFRQIIRNYGKALKVDWFTWQKLNQKSQVAGLEADDKPDNAGCVLLRAPDWQPSWLHNSAKIDQLELRRTDQPAIGDGLLYAMTEKSGKFLNYQSEAQKLAIQACLYAPSGSTTLITLPTGSGKSLCALLPAWHASKGGNIKGEAVTIVVVPTVALALDQRRQARRYFEDAPYQPECWIGSTDAETRTTIRRGLEQGTLPILFLSPEALLNSELHTISMEAARKGYIKRLVVDEAHLIETWGAGFRTEFQLIAGFKKKLLEASQGRLSTVLMSATISDSCEELLEKLFAPNEKYYSVCANRLRPELSYWFSFERDAAIREERVWEAIHHLPRPLILYVTQPKEAKEWQRKLRQRGFGRTGCFTGETKPDDRLALIERWNKNELDIMVATSAFGLGVDKSDVRTVIHACLPENLDRFYQEVGRAGRDGFSAISLVCSFFHDDGGDNKITSSMASKALITSQKALDRWEAMFATRRSYGEQGNLFLLNLHARWTEMEITEANQGWNEHTLLLMQRAGLLELLDRQTEIDPTADEIWFPVKLLPPYFALQGKKDKLLEAIEKRRDGELNRIQGNLAKMRQLVESFAKKPGKYLVENCLAEHLAELYPACALACGGCPVCRYQNIAPYSELLEPRTHLGFSEPGGAFVESKLERRIGENRMLNLYWEGWRDVKALREAGLGALLKALVACGFQQLILPTELLDETSGFAGWKQALIADLAQVYSDSQFGGKLQLLLFHETLTQRQTYRLPTLPTVVVYPPTDAAADEFHTYFCERYRDELLQNAYLVNIVPGNLYLASESGLFAARFGLDDELQAFRKYLNSVQEEALEFF
jgi:ATP-dependent DNA helicase RecQ